jgi:putative addiction module antidote
MTTVTITSAGDSTGIVLPAEILVKLRVKQGDLMYVRETPNGVELTAHNPQFAEQVAAAEHVMRSGRNVLKKLA